MHPHGPSPRYGRSLMAVAALALSACAGHKDPSPQGVDGPPTPDSIPPVQPRSGVVKTDKVDLLFVIDNSMSMADKQQVLALAVADLVQRLTNPYCLDSASGMPVARSLQPTSAAQPCPSAARREFPPTTDIHVGVISTSLGGRGADQCSADSLSYNPRQDEMSHLLDRGPAGTTVPTYQNLGFLNWDPLQQSTPPGSEDPSVMARTFGDLILGVGQDGCGYESSLEAWYRFLVDPAPYARKVPAPCTPQDPFMSCRQKEGVDDALLSQRQAFLRQDSLLSIILLTDENDCSLNDEPQSYLAFQARSGAEIFQLPPGTNACKVDPEHPDCMSCALADAARFPECADGWQHQPFPDSINLRCFHQKERFGIDFLHPTSRYVQALTQPLLPDGTLSPLFCKDRNADGTTCATPLRDPSQIVFAGVVGVPWQDAARDPGDLNQGYLPAEQLDWPAIAADPLMIESIEPRTGVHPFTNAPLAPPGTPPDAPEANPVNGAERPIPDGHDLQYACTFPLPNPVDCAADGVFCDCMGSGDNPLCWNGAQQSYGELQTRAKAYPSVRQLEVLRQIGSQAVVASICPSNLHDPTSDDYGYRPAIRALGDRMRANLDRESP